MSMKEKFLRFFRGKDTTYFRDHEEGEIVNILIAIFVVVSLLLFPLPLYGIVAVFAWLFVLGVSIYRKYTGRSILVICIVIAAITGYQAHQIPGYLEERRLYDNLVEVTPAHNYEHAPSHELTVEITNDNVKTVHYMFSRTKNWAAFDRGEFSTLEFDEDGYATAVLEDLPNGSYYMLLAIELHEGGTRFIQDDMPGPYRLRSD